MLSGSSLHHKDGNGPRPDPSDKPDIDPEVARVNNLFPGIQPPATPAKGLTYAAGRIMHVDNVVPGQGRGSVSDGR